MTSFEAFRQISRAAVVSVALFLTLTRPACTYLNPEALHSASTMPLADASQGSRFGAYDTPGEDYDADLVSPAVIRDYSLEHNTYGRDDDLLKWKLLGKDRMEVACSAYPYKAACEKITARDSKNELKDQNNILRMLGNAPLEKYHHLFSKPGDQRANKNGALKLLKLLSKAELGKAGDFGFKLTNPALKQRSGDIDLSLRMRNELTGRIGNFGRARNSRYDSYNYAENRHQGKLQDSIGTDHRSGPLNPVFVNMFRRPHYSASSSIPRSPSDSTPNAEATYLSSSVNADGLSAEDPFDSEEFQKFKRNVENIFDVPVRLGYARFSSTKPNLGPAPSMKSSSGRHGRSASPGHEVARDVCPSTSDWVSLTEARDPYGTRIKVLATIPYNGTIVRQYFYETFCALKHRTKRQMNWTEPGVVEEDGASIDEQRECLGIDTKVL